MRWIIGGSRAARAGAFLAVASAALWVGAPTAGAAVKAQVVAGTLTFTGDNASDKLSLQFDPVLPGTLDADVGEDGTVDFRFDRNAFNAIDVRAGGGDDDIRFGNGFAGIAVSVEGGAGDDTIVGSDGADQLDGGGGNDVITGGRGNDTALLGGGNDRFIWNPGDASDTVEGQGGHDALDFNGANVGEQIHLTANGERVLLQRDIAAITIDTDDVETVDLRTLGGTDTVTVGDLGGTGTKLVNVDLGGTGGTPDGQPDTVIADGTPGDDAVRVRAAEGSTSLDGLAARTVVTGGDASLDTFEFAGQDGADTVATDASVAGDLPVLFDGGAGDDSARFDGTPDADQIGIQRTGTTAATVFAPGATPLEVDPTVEHVTVSGRAGDDAITAGNGLADITSLDLDGGPGNDTIVGGDGADLLDGGGGDDVVTGGRGDDTALLGGGNDRFIWNPGDASDTVEGQGGHDALDFNGSNVAEHIDLSANGDRLSLHRDIANVTTDAHDVETVDLLTLGGADTVTVNDLTGTRVKTVNVGLGDFSGSPDGQADTVVVNGTAGDDRVAVATSGQQVTVSGLAATTTVTGADPSLDVLAVNTLGGDDTVTVDPSVSTLLTPLVDLGADQ